MAHLISRGWSLIVVLISIHTGWDGWMASLTQWRWLWVDSRSWWWTGRPGVLWSMGSRRVGHDWVTELNWIIGSVQPLYICWLAICISLKDGLHRTSGSDFLMTMVVMMVVAVAVMTTQWMEHLTSIQVPFEFRVHWETSEVPMEFPVLYRNRDWFGKKKKDESRRHQQIKELCSMSRRSTSLGPTNKASLTLNFLLSWGWS